MTSHLGLVASAFAKDRRDNILEEKIRDLMAFLWMLLYFESDPPHKEPPMKKLHPHFSSHRISPSTLL
jgi:hypothetical protein